MAFPSLFISLSGWRSRLLEPYVSGSCISRLTETCGTNSTKRGGTFHLPIAIPLYIFLSSGKTFIVNFYLFAPFSPLPLRVKLVGGRSGHSKYGIPFFCFLIVRNGIYLVYIYVPLPLPLSPGLVSLLHFISSISLVG